MKRRHNQERCALTGCAPQARLWSGALSDADHGGEVRVRPAVRVTVPRANVHGSYTGGWERLLVQELARARWAGDPRGWPGRGGPLSSTVAATRASTALLVGGLV